MLFCKNCGCRLDDDMLCPRCGWNLKTDGDYRGLYEKPDKVHCVVQKEGGKCAYVPTWLEAFSCVPLDWDMPMSSYFTIWYDIPTERRSPLLSTLAYSFPLKKRGKLKGVVSITAAIAALSAMTAALALVIMRAGGINIVI